jgi:hypothetical protein
MRSSSPGIVAVDPRHSHSIKLKLRDLSQLFNSMDPSPFVEKDLDDDAEEFIVSWAEEFPPDAKVRLHVYLEQWPDENPTELIRQAVYNHFTHRAELTDLEFRHLMKQGRTSLLIGLSFLAVCLAISETLFLGEVGTWAAILRESLTRSSLLKNCGSGWRSWARGRCISSQEVRGRTATAKASTASCGMNA